MDTKLSQTHFKSNVIGDLLPLQGEGHKFKSCSAHQENGAVVQLVRIPACHAGGRGFESRPLRQYLFMRFWE